MEPNHYNVMVLVEGAMTARCRFSLGVLFLCLCGMAVTQTFAQVGSDVPSQDIRVTLLGTASGPRAFVDPKPYALLACLGGSRCRVSTDF